MMAPVTTASRAQLFMRQCRVSGSSRRNPNTTFTIPRRAVSSSHLAPSNFSRPLRFRDEPQHNSSSTTDGTNPDSDYRLPTAATAPFKPTAASLSSSATQSSDPSSHHPSPRRAAITTIGPPIPGGFLNFLKYRVLNLPPPRQPHKPPPFNIQTNPYRARKSWPPDFRNLHPKQQFHFEKTYRRRLIIKAKSQRYNWNRYIRLLQQSLIVFSLIYFVFIADPYVKEGGGTPLDGFRAWFFGQFAKNDHIPESLKEQSKELQAYYSRNWNRKDEERDEVVVRAMESNMESSKSILEKRGSRMAEKST